MFQCIFTIRSLTTLSTLKQSVLFTAVMSVVNFRILENRVSRLQGHLQRLQQQTSANQNCQLDTTHLNSLYEDLHWLVLITSKSPGENLLNCNL